MNVPSGRARLAAASKKFSKSAEQIKELKLSFLGDECLKKECIVHSCVDEETKTLIKQMFEFVKRESGIFYEFLGFKWGKVQRN